MCGYVGVADYEPAIPDWSRVRYLSVLGRCYDGTQGKSFSRMKERRVKFTCKGKQAIKETSMCSSRPVAADTDRSIEWGRSSFFFLLEVRV